MKTSTSEDGATNRVGSTGGSAFLANLHHMCAQTDGTYRFPNSREGDMLKTAKREIEQLRSALSRVKQQTKDYDRYSLPGVLHRIASEGLSPNIKSSQPGI